MKSYLHVLVGLAFNAKIADANFHYTDVTWPNYSKALYGINNRNEISTHQGMDSRHLQKVNSSDKKVLGEHPTQYKLCYR